MTKYSIIAAVSDNYAIGKNNSIPWHISEDLKLFKRLTLNNIIIMGRLTFESIGKALPGRKTIVVTGTPDVFMKDRNDRELYAAGSLDAALTLAGEMSSADEAKVFVAGGASIYRQAFSGAEKLYISRIPGEYDADTFFPRPGTEWRMESSEQFGEFRLEIYSR